MAKLLLWIGWLVLLLLLSVALSPNKLLTPQFVFIGGFIPQAVFALFFVKKWDLDFNMGTMIALFGGTALFFVISLLAEQCLFEMRRTFPKTTRRRISSSSTTICVEKWKLIFLLIIQTAIFMLVVQYFMDNIPGKTLFAKIANYNQLSKYGNDEDILLTMLPDWIDLPRIFSGATCYITGYILVHSIVYKYKSNKILLILNIIVSLFNNGILGGRFNIMAFIVTTAAETYLLWGKRNNWKKRMKIKTVLTIITLGVVIVCGLQWSLRLFGRESTMNMFDYIGEYLSAQLKNLDIYVAEGKYGAKMTEWVTIRNILNFLEKRFGLFDLPRFDLAFNSVNGFNLGNAYTTFFYFLHDGGYFGLIVYVILMALISQFSFQKATFPKAKDPVDLSVIAYSYMTYGLFFCFFDNRFYISIVSVQFIEILAVCWILKFFLIKVHLVKNEEKHTTWASVTRSEKT